MNVLKLDALFCAIAFFFCLGLMACGDSASSTEGGTTGLLDGGTSNGGKCFVTAVACPTILEPGTICDVRDGQIYEVVTIGSQTWMAENLNVCSGTGWCYDDKAENCEKYGRLYTWSAAMGIDDSYQKKFANIGKQVQGICPEGFHIPNNADWNMLDEYVLSTYDDVNSSLRGGTDWHTNVGYLPTNETGFNALPSGEKNITGFTKLGDQAFFWAAEEDTMAVGGIVPDGRTSFIRTLNYFGGALGGGNSFKDSGLSVRCVKNL